MTQAQAFSIMKTGVNIYLTGSAGSGKTYLLNQYIQYCKDHDITVACTASTGIASTHMNGMTIHGWSGIGIKETLTEHDIDALEQKSYLWKRFDKTKVLIIDEVSMLHAHRLDMVNTVCKRFKRNDKPFGGLQVILSGDFFQLPPINKNNQLNNKDIITHSTAWEEMNPAVCYLTEQYRQEDQVLTNILNNIRDNKIGDSDIKLLEERIGAPLQQDIQPTKLYTHNVHVDSENVQELEKIIDQQEVFNMETTGHEVLVDILKKSCLAQEKLILKVGAEVMYIKNNFEQNYVNGTRGKVVGFSEGFQSRDKMPIVRLYNGKTVYTNYETWEIEENGKVKASLKALPLRLAWAITIHKSQGMSLDHAQIDLSNTFSYGMGYVALSRVRTLSGITLVGFNPNSLAVDPEVLKLDKELRKHSEENIKLFGALKKSAQEKLEHDCILKNGWCYIQ
jgi:ATP-dependent exoDNAse (exonuclease V) alpha subunit